MIVIAMLNQNAMATGDAFGPFVNVGMANAWLDCPMGKREIGSRPYTTLQVVEPRWM